MKHCRICGIELTEKNLQKHNKEKYNWICNTCYSKKQKKYYKDSKKYREWKRNYNKTHYLGIRKKGKSRMVKVKKRPLPRYCELCNEGEAKLYHHWNDEKLYHGIWIDRICHAIVEAWEQGRTLPMIKSTYFQKYLALKTKIEKEWNPSSF